MLVTGTAMPAPAKNPYLIYKICFLHIDLQRQANIPCQYVKPFNMKFIFPVLASASIFITGCTKAYTESSCINKKIAAIKAQKKWNPPASVSEYLYKGKTVYLFSSDCCDQFNYLYDETCNKICAPSGGITGHGDGTCTDFSDSSKLIRVVWQDER